MSLADYKRENQQLRLKLQEALRRCAEMETNQPLKTKLEVGAQVLGEHRHKKVDETKRPG